MISSDIKNAIRVIAKQRGVSVSSLEKLSGLGDKTLRLSNKSYNLSTIATLLNTLGITFYQFASYVDKEKQKRVKMNLWALDHDTYLKAHYGRIPGRALVQKINERFGTTYTRNALIGRAKRLGLCIDMHKARELKLTSGAKPKKRVKVMKEKPVVVETVIPMGVPFHLLTESQCQWAVGDLFCGLKRGEHRNYCPVHAKANKRRAENEVKYLTTGYKTMYGYK